MKYDEISEKILFYAKILHQKNFLAAADGGRGPTAGRTVARAGGERRSLGPLRWMFVLRRHQRGSAPPRTCHRSTQNGD